MTSSYSYTESATFTVVHARHMAAKVATDLKRMQRFYGMPTDARITQFEDELTTLIKGRFVESVLYGFQRNGVWIPPTLQYTSRELGAGATVDDDPGRVKPGADISGATFHSYLTFTRTWHALPASDRVAVERQLPFVRSSASEPRAQGYFQSDLTYSAGGRSLGRSTLRGY